MLDNIVVIRTGKPRDMAKEKPEPPSPTVAEKQDPEHDEADFLQDLERATKRLERPSSRDPGSAKTSDDR